MADTYDVDDTGGWDATHEAAAAAAAAHAAAHAAHMHEDHHGTTADPVLAAATAAAMDAAGGQEDVDEDATEAAVAVAAVLPGEEHDADAMAEAHAAAAAAEAHHHHSHHHHHHHLGHHHHHHGEVGVEEEDAVDHAAVAHHHHQQQIHHVVAPMVIGTKTRKNFDERLKELRKFKQKHGHANVPQKYAPNPQLGTWVDTQRRLYRMHKRNPSKPCTLTPENIQKLLDVGFNFEPRSSREESWNTRLAELAQFRSQHGHCNVREDDQTFPGLGKWVSYIRRQYRLIRQGRKPKESKRLSPARMQQLREIGFIFELREEMAHKRFREGINALREFINEHGHASVPGFYEKNPTLGLVVEEMKREGAKLQMGQPSTMPEDMLSDLIDLGIVGAHAAPPELGDPHGDDVGHHHIGDDDEVGGHHHDATDVPAEVTAAAAAAAAAAVTLPDVDVPPDHPEEIHEGHPDDVLHSNTTAI